MNYLFFFTMLLVVAMFLFITNHYKAAGNVLVAGIWFCTGYHFGATEFAATEVSDTKVAITKRQLAELETFGKGKPFENVTRVSLEFYNGDELTQSVKDHNLIFYVKGYKK